MPSNLLTREGDPAPAITLETIATNVRALGDSAKEQNDRIQREWAQFKETLNGAQGRVSAETEEKLNRLSASIVERMTAMENGQKSRLDSLETALQRTSFAPAAGASLITREHVAEWMATRAAFDQGVEIPDEGFCPDAIRQEHVDAFLTYRKAFRAYLRKGGDDPKNMVPEIVRELSVGVDPEGGYFVTPAISARIRAKIFDKNPMREIAGMETISTDALEVLIDYDDLDVDTAAEKQARVPTSTPEIGKIRIVAQEYTASPLATQKFLEDSAVDAEAWLGRKLGDKFARKEGYDMVLGDGVNRCSGFMNTTVYPSVTTEPSWALHQIQTINSGSTSGLSYDGITEILANLKEDYHRNAIWVMKRAAIGQVMRIKDGDDRYIFAPVMMDAGRLMMTLMGYPIRFFDAMPLPANNILAYAFGDFREGYTIADRIGMSTLRDPYTRKPFVEYYTRRRVGGGVTNFDAIKRVKCAA
jgi:HK97 family phage major capsid protein